MPTRPRLLVPLVLAIASQACRAAPDISRPHRPTLASVIASWGPTPGAAATPAPPERTELAEVPPEPARVPPLAPRVDPRYAELPAITFRAVNLHDEALRLRLYHADGSLDARAVLALQHLFRDVTARRECTPVTRTLQLLVRIATHFGADRVDVLSACRTGRSRDGSVVRREGYHGVGSAVDFVLPGADMAEVAAYARTFAHVGVGLYPEQGFVHLDSRAQTFFWENAGRAHRPGWDRPLDRRAVAVREAAWTLDDDSPWDGFQPAALVLHPRTQPGSGSSRDRLQANRGAAIVRTRPRPPIRIFNGTP